METVIRKIGNSSGIILPKDLLDELNIKEGDRITIKKAESHLELFIEDSEFAQWAESYRNANKNYKDVLKELAK